jgi:hypothetical protein
MRKMWISSLTASKSYMFKSKLALFIFVTFFLCSCKTDHEYNYAIKDFRKPLQPWLTKIVSKGIVMNYDSVLRNMATDQELIQLGQSEHPILRSSAFREMLQRSSFNHFDILMNHLEDTAFILVDRGEFGVIDRTVSDDILQEATWKTQRGKDKTIDAVLSSHNYLKSAYYILSEIDPQTKFYSIIKNMATRPRSLTEDSIELEFGDIEYALYGLAKFKKQSDIEIIKKRMRGNVSRLSFISFRLMAEYPDTAYFDILRAYHRHQFYRSSGHSRNGFSGYVVDRADPEDFIQALVNQQSKKSAQLLDTMLHVLTLQSCFPNKDYVIEETIRQIWDNPCPAYASLREKIKPKAKEIFKQEIVMPRDSSNTAPIDTVKKIIRW